MATEKVQNPRQLSNTAKMATVRKCPTTSVRQCAMRLAGGGPYAGNGFSDSPWQQQISPQSLKSSWCATIVKWRELVCKLVCIKFSNLTISWEICFARWFALQGGVPMQCMQSNFWLPSQDQPWPSDFRLDDNLGLLSFIFSKRRLRSRGPWPVAKWQTCL
jgi:hypothetical protein